MIWVQYIRRLCYSENKVIFKSKENDMGRKEILSINYT